MERLDVACQQYTWFTYFQREGKDWFGDMDQSMKALIDSGTHGYEPSFDSVEQVSALQEHMTANGVWARSLYVNSFLHDPSRTEESIRNVLEIAQAAVDMGVEIIVTNPSPIAWGTSENKSDKELATQAAALDELGAALRKLGLSLTYHNHDAEMRESAREFHHMMLGTDPENVRLCLDAHWVYRGSGNSQIALFDIVKLYADRIVELHLRQSHQGVWSETFTPGDIDYQRLVDMLLERNIRPHLVLEQAVEEGTPHTLNAIEAMKQSLAYVEEVFAAFGK